jgi:preprotein translocase subunit SecD
MNSRRLAFNLILAVLFGSLVACKSPQEKKDEKAKQATFLRFHLETNPNASGRTAVASVYRAHPVLITVDRDAVLDEGFLAKIEVVDADEHGGIALKATFDEAGTRRLDAVTIEHRGKRLAIRAVWTDNRWLAAPLLTKRISNGEFIFTPDATREEADRIVVGLRNVIKKLNERYTL